MTALERYGAFFAAMQPADLDRLDAVFVENARFRDPFNEVEGLTGIRAVFEHMYANCAAARFEVLETVGEGATGYLRWRFHFRLKRDRHDRRPIDGVSRVVLAEDGRVREHIDYWDAAGELYDQFPVLGGLMRWLRARLSVDA
ncbi:nuclear transport factor 2 family protein [Spiribacter roseus]|uniref:Nuclear transport factor 2 family protein n=1 Tax=Spiribacter roseus TaxID=1855875 RepID=A0ABV3RXI8_9GAMM